MQKLYVIIKSSSRVARPYPSHSLRCRTAPGAFCFMGQPLNLSTAQSRLAGEAPVVAFETRNEGDAKECIRSWNTRLSVLVKRSSETPANMDVGTKHLVL